MTVAAEKKIGFDFEKIRRDFPILSQKFHGKPLIYFDNAATTQKPQSVIDRLNRYYEEENSNIHRGVYALSQKATHEYEQARRRVREFIHAREDAECIFTRGTTESINLVASSWGRANLRSGDEVLISALEHHSNIVPWQMVCEAMGAKLRVVPINDEGELLMDEYRRMLSPRVKMVAITHSSNSLGTINDVAAITRFAHEVGAKVLIDGAQWVAHHPTDVQEIGCDFYAFSGHKLYGPTGIGVLYGRREVLDAMPPYQGGGDMIENVSFEKTTYAQLPNKFEAGTPHIAGAIGLGAAIEYLNSLNWSFVDYERELLEYATAKMRDLPGLRVIGNAREKGTVISFEIDGISSLDIGAKLDGRGIAIRTGHHCCQPLMERLHITGTARASLAMYNTREEVDALVGALANICESAKSSIRREAGDVIAWPTATAKSPQAVADELAEVFDLLEDREQRNQYVLDLAEKLPNTFELLKKITPRVQGCMSEVYLVGRKSPNAPDRFEFVADANAEIVRGLIAILQKLYSGQRADDVLKFDIEKFFHRIGLDQFISSQRRNGLAGMVQRIHASAKQLKESA